LNRYFTAGTPRYQYEAFAKPGVIVTCEYLLSPQGLPNTYCSLDSAVKLEPWKQIKRLRSAMWSRSHLPRQIGNP